MLISIGDINHICTWKMHRNCSLISIVILILNELYLSALRTPHALRNLRTFERNINMHIIK